PRCQTPVVQQTAAGQGPVFSDAFPAQQGGYLPPAAPWGPLAQPPPVWQPEAEWKDRPGQDSYLEEIKALAGNKTTGQFLLLLFFGLFPLAGIAVSLLWAFGKNTDGQTRALARAMLWLHGAALLLAIAGLGAWVLGLLPQYTGGISV
ncbi:MAG: hypothetical protein ACK5L3_04425, partial [Oscillospiraceae bacterium]